MKYVKMLGLAAIAAMALMAFVGAGTASATTLTSPKGTDYKGPIVASQDPGAGNLVLTGGFKTIECAKGTVGGEVTEIGGATKTVKGRITSLTFSECNCEVVVVKTGVDFGGLEIHVIGTGPNGTLTGSESKVTVNCNTIFGTVHCIYVTSGTHLGTLTGSTTTGGTATMDITAEIPRENTNALCAEEAIWHAKYIVTTPDFLDVS